MSEADRTLTYRERRERDAWLSYANGLIERPIVRRLYLGDGIWWEPSRGFWNSKLGRQIGAKLDGAHHDRP